MLMSSSSMNVPRHTAARVHHLRRGAAGASLPVAAISISASFPQDESGADVGHLIDSAYVISVNGG
jgi:hypothetical protein